MSDTKNSNATNHTLQEPTPDELKPVHQTILRLLLHKPCYATEIHRFTGRSLYFLLQQLKLLLAKGLITRHPDPFITYRSFYQLTPSARHHTNTTPSTPLDDIQAAIQGDDRFHQILISLAQQPKTPVDLGRQFGLYRQTVSGWLKKFIEKGLVTPTTNPLNISRSFYQLTEKGYHAISRPPQPPQPGLIITVRGKGWAHTLLTHIVNNPTNVAKIAQQLNWVEATTVLRIERLQDHDLLIATTDLLDSRIKYYQLTPTARHLLKLPPQPLKGNTTLTIQNHTIIQHLIHLIRKSSGIDAVRASRLLKCHRTHLRRILHLLRKLKLLKALNNPKMKRLRYTLTNHGLRIAQQTGILSLEKEGESDG